MPHEKPTYLTATLQGWACDILHGTPEDLGTSIWLHCTTLSWKQGPKSLVTPAWVCHCALPALNEDHLHWGAGKAFIDGIQELLLGGEKRVNEALRQTLEQVIKLRVRCTVRLQETSGMILWRCQPAPPPTEWRDYWQLKCQHCRNTGYVQNSVPNKWKKCQTQHDMELFIKASPPQRTRNGDTPVDYLGEIALRREQCDVTAESRKSGTKKRQPLLGNRMINMFIWQWINTQQWNHWSDVSHPVHAEAIIITESKVSN